MKLSYLIILSFLVSCANPNSEKKILDNYYSKIELIEECMNIDILTSIERSQLLILCDCFSEKIITLFTIEELEKTSVSNYWENRIFRESLTECISAVVSIAKGEIKKSMTETKFLELLQFINYDEFCICWVTKMLKKYPKELLFKENPNNKEFIADCETNMTKCVELNMK